MEIFFKEFEEYASIDNFEFGKLEANLKVRLKSVQSDISPKKENPNEKAKSVRKLMFCK